MKKRYAWIMMLALSGCTTTPVPEVVEPKAEPYDPLQMPLLEPYALKEAAAYSLPTQTNITTVKELEDEISGSTYNLDLLTQKLRRQMVGTGAQVKAIHHRVQVIIPGKVLFGSNKKTIKGDFEKQLRTIADILKEYDQTMIKIVGYTGNEISVLKSQSISLEQAQVIANYFKSQGISSQRILALGKGQEDPVASNQTPEGRARNYRVEINILNLL